MSEQTYTKTCYCCQETKECLAVSATSDGKGEPRLVCKKCNYIGA